MILFFVYFFTIALSRFIFFKIVKCSSMLSFMAHYSKVLCKNNYSMVFGFWGINFSKSLLFLHIKGDGKNRKSTLRFLNYNSSCIQNHLSGQYDRWKLTLIMLLSVVLNICVNKVCNTYTGW